MCEDFFGGIALAITVVVFGAASEAMRIAGQMSSMRDESDATAMESATKRCKKS